MFAYDHVVGESGVEWHSTLYLANVLRRECDVECFKVGVQMFDLSPSDDREHIRDLLHNVGDSDCTVETFRSMYPRMNMHHVRLTSLDGLCANLGGYFLQHLDDLALVLSALPVGRDNRPSYM